VAADGDGHPPHSRTDVGVVDPTRGPTASGCRATGVGGGRRPPAPGGDVDGGGGDADRGGGGDADRGGGGGDADRGGGGGDDAMGGLDGDDSSGGHGGLGAAALIDGPRASGGSGGGGGEDDAGSADDVSGCVLTSDDGGDGDPAASRSLSVGVASGGESGRGSFRVPGRGSSSNRLGLDMARDRGGGGRRRRAGVAAQRSGASAQRSRGGGRASRGGGERRCPVPPRVNDPSGPANNTGRRSGGARGTRAGRTARGRRARGGPSVNRDGGWQKKEKNGRRRAPRVQQPAAGGGRRGRWRPRVAADAVICLICWRAGIPPDVPLGPGICKHAGGGGRPATAAVQQSSGRGHTYCTWLPRGIPEQRVAHALGSGPHAAHARGRNGWRTKVDRLAQNAISMTTSAL